MAVRKLKSPFDSYVVDVPEVAPYTQIVNRAPVSRSFKAIMGTEPIKIPAVFKVPNEFGPNGETVWETDEADSRIRFVGVWENASTSNGTCVYAPTGANGSFAEVTFYGTGLNLIGYSSAFARTWDYSVDGAPSGTITLTTSNSSILAGRSYNMNTIFSIVKDLDLGWHTVKLELTSGDNRVFGFEILNESDDIIVCAGKGHANGYEVSSDVDVVVGKYNTEFENVADIDVGTKGGRVIVYTDPIDNTTKKALTKVDATAQYLVNADHSNESVKRIINFRELGRNRSDDFSTTASNTYGAFTLDDGSTTLVGKSISIDTQFGEGIALAQASDSFWTLTFFGVGLDIISVNSGMPTSNVNLDIDGVSIQTNISAWNIEGKQNKICSGLPLGTHTVKISQPVGGAGLRTSDFIIYQPKKSSIPEGAIIHGEYNILADRVVNNIVGRDSISSGVVRKTNDREILYSGAWSISSIATHNYINGFHTGSSTVGVYYEYDFRGTGIDIRFWADLSQSGDWRVTLNGIPVTTANFPTLSLTANGPGIGYNFTTGSIDALATGDVVGASVTFSNLPLATYKLRVTNNAAGNINLNALDIITPIYNMDTYDGSMGIKDSRNFNPLKTINKRTNREFESFVYCDELSSKYILKSKNISQILNTATGRNAVYFKRVYVDREIAMTSGGKSDGNIAMQIAGATTFKEKHMALVMSYNGSGALQAFAWSLNAKAELEQDFLEE